MKENNNATLWKTFPRGNLKLIIYLYERGMDLRDISSSGLPGTHYSRTWIWLTIRQLSEERYKQLREAHSKNRQLFKKQSVQSWIREHYHELLGIAGKEAS